MTTASTQVALARTTLAEKRLYKFRSFSDGTQQARIKDILLNHRIRFSRPSELNDPIEGKPIFCLGDWDSQTYRTQFEEWVWNTQKHIGNRTPEEAFLAWFRTLSKEQHEEFIKQINDNNQAMIESKWRVLSLSAISTHDLLWSHYSDSHRGLALVLDASGGEFGIAFKVNYVPERTPVEISAQNETTILLATILTKRMSWAYEEEYRCVAGEPWDPLLKLDNQFLQFDPRRLLGIIFGAKMTSENIQTIVGWSKERHVPLAFWRASISSGGSVVINQHVP